MPELDLHVVRVIGEYAFRRVFTGWFVRLLAGAAIMVLVILFTGGPEPAQALIEHRSLVVDMIYLVVMVLVVVMGATEIPQDIATRSALIVLSKPVNKSEFVLGKYFGLILVAAVATLVLGLVCILGTSYIVYTLPETESESVLYSERVNGDKAKADKAKSVAKEKAKKSGKSASDADIPVVADVSSLKNPFNVNIVQNMGFTFFSAVVLSAAVILLSTQLTEIPVIFMSAFYLFIGTIIFYLHAILCLPTLPFSAKAIVSLLYYLVPNMRYMQIPPEVAMTGSANWLHFFMAILYSLVYSAILVFVAMRFFENREVAG